MDAPTWVYPRLDQKSRLKSLGEFADETPPRTAQLRHDHPVVTILSHDDVTKRHDPSVYSFALATLAQLVKADLLEACLIAQMFALRTLRRKLFFVELPESKIIYSSTR
jgi:hypothetical protein